jgi:EF hand
MKTRLICSTLLLACLLPDAGVRAAGFISQKKSDTQDAAKPEPKEGGEAKAGEKPAEGRKETPEKPKPAPEKPKEKPAKPKTEVEQAVEEHFERYDKDGNEKISLAEFRTTFRGSDMGEGPKLFQERDGDKDGSLSKEEFVKINPKKLLSATEQDRIEGRDWKEEREKRERERERKKDRR